MKFVFSLEALLSYRTNLEEKERMNLRRIHGEIEAERTRSRELEARAADTADELGRRRSGEGDPREIDWYSRYLDRLRFESVQSCKRIEELNVRLEERKRAWIEASRSKKVLERLRARQEREFARAQDRAEQKTIDELAVAGFARNK